MKKILIVDDDAVGLTMLKDIVNKTGHSIVTATSGLEAIEKAKTEKPDLIFMDIVMEGMDGYSACRELSQNEDTQDIPVIFVSSKSQKADHIWAKKQGGRALISKPFEEQQILDQLKLYT